MDCSRATKRIVFFTSLLPCLAVLPAEASDEAEQSSRGPVSGWAGIVGGLLVGSSDDPVLPRLTIQGGAGLRLGDTPFAIEGGLALSAAGGPQKNVDYDLGPEVPPFTISTEQLFLEAVPFVRGVYLLGDSLGFYLGAGAGVARFRRHHLIRDAFKQQGSTEHALGSIQKGLNSDELVLPDGGSENALMLRLFGGFEYTMQEALRVFIEPLAINTYHLEDGISLRFAFTGGFASVF